ncbi:MAG: MMPL family transporter [Nocardioides sp.]|nr:MMPL family transporter [Nocardioides sp.]
MDRRIAGRLTGRVTKWIVVAFWLVLAVAASVPGSKLAEVQDNQQSSYVPESAESTRALERLGPFQDPAAIPTLVVYERTSGLTEADFAAIADQASRMQDVEGVSGDVVFATSLDAGRQSGLVSQDGQLAQTQVTFDFGTDPFTKIPDAVEAIRDIGGLDGGSTYVAGAGGQFADAAAAFSGIDGVLILATLLVVIVILLLTYRSPILWLLPIIAAVVAYIVSGAVVYYLARSGTITVNGQSQGILPVLVIGAGTDYALLLVARYREELRRHVDRHEAMAFALHRAAPAIFASAATVVLGMLCLLVAEMNSTKGLGPVLAVGITVTFLVMVTLLPAMLVVTGRWVFWPKRPTFESAEPSAAGIWATVGRRIAVRPRAVWVGAALLLAVACLGTLQLNAEGLSTEDTYTKKFDSVRGQEALVAHDLADTSNTLLVVSAADQDSQVKQALAGVEGLTVPPGGPPVIADGVAFNAGLIEADVSSSAAFETVAAARDAVHAVPGEDPLVGGGSAFYLDTKDASARDNRVIIPIVLLVVLLVLIVLLRALVAPLILIGTVVLSFGAALGISALLFTHVFGFAGTDAAFPLFAFVFLVALGIDYNIFLMTRVREESLVHGTRVGSLRALTSTGGVITSAGIVLAATFVVLGTIPVVFLAELGVAVALGVLLDTIIVRSVLVTAINLDLGDRIWWPSALAHGPTRPPTDAPTHSSRPRSTSSTGVAVHPR